MARSDWSLRLPRPLIIQKVMTLATLADVRTLIMRSICRRALSAISGRGRHVAAELDKAAAGGDAAEAYARACAWRCHLRWSNAGRSETLH